MNPVWLIKLLFPQLYKYKPLCLGIEILSEDVSPDFSHFEIFLLFVVAFLSPLCLVYTKLYTIYNTYRGLYQVFR